MAVEVKSRVLDRIAAHKKVFDEKEPDEQIALREEAEKQGDILSHQRHHRVECPACKCVATVQGDTNGREQIEHTEDEIIVRQTVIPTKLLCTACGLKINGYGELSSASVADHFTHGAIILLKSTTI